MATLRCYLPVGAAASYLATQPNPQQHCKPHQLNFGACSHACFAPDGRTYGRTNGRIISQTAILFCPLCTGHLTHTCTRFLPHNVKPILKHSTINLLLILPFLSPNFASRATKNVAIMRALLTTYGHNLSLDTTWHSLILLPFF